MSKESIIAFSQAKAELLWLQDLRQAAFDKLESLALPKIECNQTLIRRQTRNQ